MYVKCMCQGLKLLGEWSSHHSVTGFLQNGGFIYKPLGIGVYDPPLTVEIRGSLEPRNQIPKQISSQCPLLDLPGMLLSIFRNQKKIAKSTGILN